MVEVVRAQKGDAFIHTVGSPSGGKTPMRAALVPASGGDGEVMVDSMGI